MPVPAMGASNLGYPSASSSCQKQAHAFAPPMLVLRLARKQATASLSQAP